MGNIKYKKNKIKMLIMKWQGGFVGDGGCGGVATGVVGG